jgi:hypothetical protein
MGRTGRRRKALRIETSRRGPTPDAQERFKVAHYRTMGPSMVHRIAKFRSRALLPSFDSYRALEARIKGSVPVRNPCRCTRAPGMDFVVLLQDSTPSRLLSLCQCGRAACQSCHATASNHGYGRALLCWHQTCRRLSRNALKRNMNSSFPTCALVATLPISKSNE